MKDIREGGPVEKRARSASPGVIRNIILLISLYLLSLLLMAIFGGDYLVFRSLFGFWTLFFLALVLSLIGSDLYGRMRDWNPRWILISAFAIGLILHLPFLFRDPIMSQDVFRLERRGELLLAGNFPYEDFNVNKPPLYIWMVGLFSLPFGPEQLAFRFFFSIINSLIPVVMILIHRNTVVRKRHHIDLPLGIHLPPMNWFDAAIAYLLCPIPILETAMAGHFDPIVIITTLFAYLYLVKNRSLFSGLLLGAGFSLKLYPMFIAPVFFFSLKGWRERLKLFVGFWIVPVVSSIPVLLRKPSLIIDYIRYQFVDWYTGYSLQGILEFILDNADLPLWIAGRLMMIILVTGFLFLLARGIVGRRDRLDAVIPIVLTFILGLYGLVQATAFITAGTAGTVETIVGMVGIVFSTVAVVASFYTFLHGYSGKMEGSKFSLKALFQGSIDIENVAYISSAILVLVIFTSSQFHPWYIPWVLPFLFASGRPYWIWSALLGMWAATSGYYPPWELGGF